MKGRIAVPREHFPELEEGEHWVTDIEGSSVVNREGENLGTVESVVDNGGQQVLKIEFTAEGKSACASYPLCPPTWKKSIRKRAWCTLTGTPTGINRHAY